MRVRKTTTERKREILQAALSVFLETGIADATMEKIIARTSLSKGGVYHYYSNPRQMLVDIFMEGNQNRLRIMRDSLRRDHLLPGDLRNSERLAAVLTDKVLNDLPESKLYALFLIEARKDPVLQNLYREIVEACRKEIAVFLGDSAPELAENEDLFEGTTHLLNMLIVGYQCLGAREYLTTRRDSVEAILNVFLSRNKTC